MLPCIPFVKVTVIELNWEELEGFGECDVLKVDEGKPLVIGGTVVVTVATDEVLPVAVM